MFLSFLKAVTKAKPFLPTISLQGGAFVDFLAACQVKKQPKNKNSNCRKTCNCIRKPAKMQIKVCKYGKRI